MNCPAELECNIICIYGSPRPSGDRQDRRKQVLSTQISQISQIKAQIHLILSVPYSVKSVKSVLKDLAFLPTARCRDPVKDSSTHPSTTSAPWNMMMALTANSPTGLSASRCACTDGSVQGCCRPCPTRASSRSPAFASLAQE